MNKQKTCAGRISILLTILIIYTIILSIYTNLHQDTIGLAVLIGGFFIGIVLFSYDFLSPYGFLFVFQFLGYADIMFVASGMRTSKGIYAESVYTKTLLIIAIWYAFFIVGSFASRKIRFKKGSVDEILRKSRSKIRAWVIILPCFLLFVFSLYNAIKKSISLGGMVQGMLGGGNAFTDQGYLMVFLGLLGVVPIALLYKHRDASAFIAMLLILGGILLTGRRSLAITTSVFPFLIYWNAFRKRLVIKNLLAIGVLILLIVMFVGSIRTAGQHGFTDTNTSNKLLTQLIVLGKYNGYGDNIPAMINKLDTKAIPFQSFSYAFRGFEYFIPRSLWPDKPLVHSSEIVSNIVFYTGDVGRPVGPYGWAYFNFGILGVIVSGITTGYIVSKLYIWAFRTNSFFSISAYCVLLLPLLEIFQPEAQIKIILFTIIINLFNKLYAKMEITRNMSSTAIDVQP